MSLQVCHCGWSKITTHQGLRTHQGMMGCTPKGMGIPENLRSLNWNKITNPAPPVKTKQPSFNTPHFQSDSNMSLQVCHCGWSSITTYQGLRTHQGMMGCTPKGLGIPENLQSLNWNEIANQAPPINAEQPSFNKPYFQSAFETPQNFHQITAKSDKSCRRLDFSTQEPQVNSFLQPPSTAGQEPAWRNPKEKAKKKEQDRQLQMQVWQEQMKVELQRQKNIREQRMEEVRSSAKDCLGRLDAEWLQINSVFSNVMNLVLDAARKALGPLEHRKREVDREAERIVQSLQRQVDKLEKDIRELDKNPQFQVSSLAIPDEETSIDTSLSFGTLRTSTSAMMDRIQLELEKLTAIELKRIPTFAVDVKLDPTTAFKSLNVSPDGKEVRDDGRGREVPDSAQRFDTFGSILGLNVLVSGRAYWEVEVGDKPGWDLGVTRRGANRKGKLKLNPDNGYWVAVRYGSEMYAAMTAPPARISLTRNPKKVGVFVDYEEGLVSFYDVSTQSHIYSFTQCSFGDKILPYFSPHAQDEKNLSPLVICAA